jgi:hypothetical protein
VLVDENQTSSEPQDLIPPNGRPPALDPRLTFGVPILVLVVAVAITALIFILLNRARPPPVTDADDFHHMDKV